MENSIQEFTQSDNLYEGYEKKVDPIEVLQRVSELKESAKIELVAAGISLALIGLSLTVNFDNGSMVQSALKGMAQVGLPTVFGVMGALGTRNNYLADKLTSGLLDVLLRQKDKFPEK